MSLAACVASYCHDDRYRNLLDTPPAQQFDTADLQEPIGGGARARQPHAQRLRPHRRISATSILQCARAAGKFEDFGKDLAAHFAVSA